MSQTNSSADEPEPSKWPSLLASDALAGATIYTQRSALVPVTNGVGTRCVVVVFVASQPMQDIACMIVADNPSASAVELFPVGAEKTGWP